MNVINYDLFCCSTLSTVICDKIYAFRNWTDQKPSYCWVLIFNCYVLQCHVTGISQTLLILILIQMHTIFRHPMIHQWHVVWIKSKSIILLIHIFKLHLIEFIIAATLPYEFRPLILLIGLTLSRRSSSILSSLSYWRSIWRCYFLLRNIWCRIRRSRDSFKSL